MAMNKVRRKEIYTIVNKLNNILINISEDTICEYIDQIADLADDTQCVYDDEYDYFSNIPENLQYSERAINSEADCDLLEEAAELLYYIEDGDTMEYIIKNIKNAINNLENIS